MCKILVTVVVLLALVGCGEPTPEDESETAQRSSRLSCNHFRNVMRDIGNGVLTPGEVREKLKEVESDALIATPEVQVAATDMLRASTQDDGEAFLGAAQQMSEACAAAGH